MISKTHAQVEESLEECFGHETQMAAERLIRRSERMRRLDDLTGVAFLGAYRDANGAAIGNIAAVRDKPPTR